MVQEASHSRDVKREKEIIKTEKGANTGHSGFGDTLESSERKTYASFIPFCHEAKTVELTPYSQESNTSKLDDDVTTVNSDDEEFGDSKQESVFEVSRSAKCCFGMLLLNGFSFRDISNLVRKFLVMESMKWSIVIH